MSRKKIWEEICSAFEQKYSWLGRQFAEEFLKSVASWNIQQFSEPEFRVRRHLLLMWQHGYLKSSLLKRAYFLLGDLAVILSDISRAALRGTVEHGKFISPFTLKKPFTICTEFGQIIGGSQNTEILQELLNLLEEGVATVSLAKISSISPEELQRAEQEFNIKFIDNNTFTYQTNWVLMAATNNRKFLVDYALESRFNLVIPKQKLDSKYVKEVNRSGPFVINLETVNKFRELITKPNKLECHYILPEEVYDYEITVRDSAYLISEALCLKWWGLKPTKEHIIETASYLMQRRKSVWQTTDDLICEILEKGPKTLEELRKESSLSTKQVLKSLRRIGAIREFDTERKQIVYKLF